MTTDELKQKIIVKAAEMIENGIDCENLHKIAATYHELTATDYMKILSEFAKSSNMGFGSKGE